MLSTILIKVVLDEFIKDFAVNLDMVWKRANSKNLVNIFHWKHFFLQDRHLPTHKGCNEGQKLLVTLRII